MRLLRQNRRLLRLCALSKQDVAETETARSCGRLSLLGHHRAVLGPEGVMVFVICQRLTSATLTVGATNPGELDARIVTLTPLLTPKIWFR